VQRTATKLPFSLCFRAELYISAPILINMHTFQSSTRLASPPFSNDSLSFEKIYKESLEEESSVSTSFKHTITAFLLSLSHTICV
jgi:hypothetical protein